MDQIVRRRRGESAWREIVARQEESGLTVQEFCKREGLKAASLYGWRVRLRREPAGQVVSSVVPPRRAFCMRASCARCRSRSSSYSLMLYVDFGVSPVE